MPTSRFHSGIPCWYYNTVKSTPIPQALAYDRKKDVCTDPEYQRWTSSLAKPHLAKIRDAKMEFRFLHDNRWPLLPSCGHRQEKNSRVRGIIFRLTISSVRYTRRHSILHKTSNSITHWSWNHGPRCFNPWHWFSGLQRPSCRNEAASLRRTGGHNSFNATLWKVRLHYQEAAEPWRRWHCVDCISKRQRQWFTSVSAKRFLCWTTCNGSDDKALHVIARQAHIILQQLRFRGLPKGSKRLRTTRKGG